MDAYQNCRYIKNGEAISGNSDDVLLFDGKCSTAEIKGNSDSRYFSVTSLNNIGRYDLLVNTTDVYSGTVMVKNEPFYLKLLHVATGPLH